MTENKIVYTFTEERSWDYFSKLEDLKKEGFSIGQIMLYLNHRIAGMHYHLHPSDSTYDWHKAYVIEIYTKGEKNGEENENEENSNG